jgi:hypothetical protein
MLLFLFREPTSLQPKRATARRQRAKINRIRKPL